mgnify:CR=1 FL=1
MTNVKIATSAEQPINRHAAVAGETMHEGDLVGIDANGQMVQADPEGVMALGVCMTPADDLANYAQDEVRLVIEAERALINRDRVTATSNGVEVENGDGDWAFTPGLPVYMGAGGEYTQTAPGTGGVQVVGSALTEDRIRLDVRPSSDW